MTKWYTSNLSHLVQYCEYRGNHIVWAESRGNQCYADRVGEFATRGEAVALMVALILGEAILKQVIRNNERVWTPVIPPGYGRNPTLWR